MLIPQIVTASFDANLAKIVGIPAAILYNKLSWMSQTDMVKDYDPDGWFYYTMNDFCEATGYKKDAYAKAIKQLEEAGFVEKKKKFVHGTSRPCNHFRILKYWELEQKEEIDTLPNRQTVTLPNRKTIISKEISKGSRNPGKATTDAIASSVADHPSEEGGNFSSLSGKDERSEVRGEAQGSGEKGGLTNDPFSAPVKDGVVSLKPEGKRKQSPEDIRAWVLVNKVTKVVRDAGFVCPDGNIALHSAIKARVKETVDGKPIDEEMILKVANAYVNAKDKFYSPNNKPAHRAFSKEDFYQYLNMANDAAKPSESIFGRN